MTEIKGKASDAPSLHWIPTKATAFKIAIVYALTGCLWILFSGQLVHRYAADKNLESSLEQAKGWLFVLVTAGLLGAALNRYFREIRHSAKRLQESERRWQFALEGVGQGVWDWNLESDDVFFSAQWKSMLGFESCEIADTREEWKNRIHPEDLPRVLKAIQRHIDGLEPVYRSEHRMRCKNGGCIWILDQGKVMSRNPDGKPARIIGTQFDITARKQAERLQILFGDVLAILNDPHTLPNSIQRILSAIKRETDLDAVGIRLRNNGDYPYCGVDGFSDNFLEAENNLVARDSSGGFCRDEEGHFRLECTCGLVLTGQIDPTHPLFTPGGSAWTNDAKSILRLPKDQDPRLSPRNRCIHEGFQSVALIPIRVNAEIIGLLQLNDRRQGCFNLDMIRFFEGVAASFGVAMARLRGEQEQRQSQKLEAIGQLAGGVAHDFNNILAAVMMNMSLIQMMPNLDGRVRAALKDLDEEIRRAATLTRQLLMFSRRSTLAAKPLDINEIVGNLLKMLIRLIGENIKLRFDGDSALPLVEADAGMMEQVLMNLVVNARDAMPKGGRITIATRLEHVAAPSVIENPDRRPGRFVTIAVSDTGVGMDKATMKRVFEPFFTTKEAGKGTGLGLATIHGIVAQHKGWVEVTSELGHGSTFQVFLPALTGSAEQSPQFVAQAPLRRGRETILVVEDSATVRQMTAQSLRTLGYSVHEAENGQEAMTVWQKQGKEVDLLFTDMVMTDGMTGLELAEKLRALKPELKVVIASGYSTEIVENGIPDKPGIVYLPKPFDAVMLAGVVRDCMDGSRHPCLNR